MEKKIILDTSFILTALKFKVDIFAEINRVCDFSYSLNIIDKILNELRDKPDSKLAIGILKQKKVGIINTDEVKDVDSLILKLINQDYIVATQDKELKRMVKDKGVQVITIKQKKYVAFV